VRIEFLHEPELEFGAGGQHIDIRFGLLHNGPLDLRTGRAPAEIKVGIVGTTETVEGMARWLERSAARKSVSSGAASSRASASRITSASTIVMSSPRSSSTSTCSWMLTGRPILPVVVPVP
jgi:hypothetical protein